ncbi:type I restriction enzyme, S subunit [Selenomonas sp. WCT3]|uniref:restriction endonuclease subunit S n=1 Tax=Selenomonas sp. WCT3 TaxID=3158785 RepID=UPI00087F9FDF|nr:type I restriction enzyme, S subunit [Selenomonas ruminantium]
MAKKQLTIEEKLQAALVPVEEQPYKVPENWCWVRLGTVASLYRGVSYKKADAHSIKKENDCLIMRGGNIGEGYIDIDVDADNVYVSSELVNEEQLIKENDIVIVASTGSKKVIGRAGISFANYSNVAFGAFLMLVRPNGKTNACFIDYYFQSELYRNKIRNLAVGVNINNIRANYITELPIPFPTLNEQNRIVRCIESLFAKLDEAKKKIQEVLDGADLRRAAILHQAFTGKLTEKWRRENSVSDAGWQDVYIEDIAQVKGGKRVPKGMSLTVENTGHPYIKAGNLKQGTVISDNIMFVPDDVLPYIKKYTVNVGDVYITNVGACIGDCGVIPAEFDGANLTENAVKLTDLECDSNYLAKYIASEFVQVEIKTRIASATLGKLSIANIKKIKVKLPTFSEQQEIVRLLDNLLSREQSTVTACEKALATIGVLKKSILARAFRGELGTNDPSEAGAQELLQEILAS